MAEPINLIFVYLFMPPAVAFSTIFVDKNSVGV
jgi:hypothetical protein